MRVSRVVCFLACSVFAFLAPVLSAQGVVSGYVGSGPIFVDGGGSAGHPYTATWSQKHVQVLANGVTITHETTSRVAHDSSGRTYNEIHQSIPDGPDGQTREIISYFVFDPVAHTTLSWSSNGKEATLVHHPEPQTVAARTAPSMQAANSQTQAPRQPRSRPNFQREELGTRTIAGVNAAGVRTTHTIPAGTAGNDQAFAVVNEMWHSTEYGTELMSVNDDPRTGKTTREVTDFQPGEPDAALFRAPEGYTVKEITPDRGVS